MFVFTFPKLIYYSDVFHFYEINEKHAHDNFRILFEKQYEFLNDNGIYYELFTNETKDDRDIVLFYKLSIVIYDETEAVLYKLMFGEDHQR
jgi:hypothetical protein